MPRSLAGVLLTLLLALAGCASIAPLPADEGTLESAPLELDGRDVTAHWYLPARAAPALVLMEHGFARRCANLRETTRRLVAAGLMALCIDAPMTAGNPALAEALASRLAQDPPTPAGRALPARWIAGGHSAGAVFALRFAAAAEAQSPGRLAGALLLDPVATRGFEADLQAVSATMPVFALLATPHGCNAQGDAAPALARSPATVVLAGPGSTHADPEGEDSDALAAAACGRPDAAMVARWRALVVDAALAMARGERPAGAD